MSGRDAVAVHGALGAAQLEIERLKAELARVRVLADQYAATAEVHAKVRDDISHVGVAGVILTVVRARAAALAGMAQHHADQLRAALEAKS